MEIATSPMGKSGLKLDRHNKEEQRPIESYTENHSSVGAIASAKATSTSPPIRTSKFSSVNEHKRMRTENDDHSLKKRSRSSLKYSEDCASPFTPIIESHDVNTSKTPTTSSADERLAHGIRSGGLSDFTISNIESRGERRKRTNKPPDMVDPELVSEYYDEVADNDEHKDERPKNDINSPKKRIRSSLKDPNFDLPFMVYNFDDIVMTPTTPTTPTTPRVPRLLEFATVPNRKSNT